MPLLSTPVTVVFLETTAEIVVVCGEGDSSASCCSGLILLFTVDKLKVKVPFVYPKRASVPFLAHLRIDWVGMFLCSWQWFDQETMIKDTNMRCLLQKKKLICFLFCLQTSLHLVVTIVPE